MVAMTISHGNNFLIRSESNWQTIDMKHLNATLSTLWFPQWTFKNAIYFSPKGCNLIPLLVIRVRRCFFISTRFIWNCTHVSTKLAKMQTYLGLGHLVKKNQEGKQKPLILFFTLFSIGIHIFLSQSLIFQPMKMGKCGVFPFYFWSPALTCL